jgi:hypothetical protein
MRCMQYLSLSQFLKEDFRRLGLTLVLVGILMVALVLFEQRSHIVSQFIALPQANQPSEVSASPSPAPGVQPES